MNFIDLFSGLGGFRIAMENNGMKCVFSSEIDKYAIATYEYNFGDIPVGDITKVNEKDIPYHDVLCGGFPCQSFSIAGKKEGFNDIRGTLFFDIVRIANYHKPKVIFCENVKNLAIHDGGATFRIIKNTLEDIGYSVFSKILNSGDFGTPQSRKRIYLIAFRKDLEIENFNFPKAINSQISLEDIIEDDTLTKEFIIDRTDLVYTKNPQNIKRANTPIKLGEIGNGGQGNRIYSQKGHSITLAAQSGGMGSKTGAYLINGVLRKLSPRECLRLQTFPETYDFPNSVSIPQCHKLCGNSVSVNVLTLIGKEIINTLNEQKISK